MTVATIPGMKTCRTRRQTQESPDMSPIVPFPPTAAGLCRTVAVPVGACAGPARGRGTCSSRCHRPNSRLLAWKAQCAGTGHAQPLAAGQGRGATTQAVAAVRESAREEGRQEVIVKNRGFFDFGSSEPIVGVLQGEFRGFGKGRVYVLDNGQEWEQIDATTLAGVRGSRPPSASSPV